MNYENTKNLNQKENLRFLCFSCQTSTFIHLTLKYFAQFYATEIPTNINSNLMTTFLKSQQYWGPNGPTASIFYGIWIGQGGAMVFILDLNKILLKKLFPTMNI